jgi:hypothetical protein
MKNLTYINFIVLLIMSIWTNAALAIPSITAATSQGTTIKFTATLSEKLLSGYKVKIDYGNGKGLVAMTCSRFTCTLSSNSLPIGVNSAAYKIGIYNAQGVLQGLSTSGTYAITYTAPVVNNTPAPVIPPVPLVTKYTKISNTGSSLSDDATLGSGSNDWACTKDKATGLIWEVKTSDDGLRDTIKTYTYASTQDFVSAVNNQSLCGSTNWRLPSYVELKTLHHCTSTKIAPICIDSSYFPNMKSSNYWTSTYNTVARTTTITDTIYIVLKFANENPFFTGPSTYKEDYLSLLLVHS